MGRLVSVVAIVFLLSFLWACPAEAGLIKIAKDGEIVWNVLSAEDSIALQIPKPSILSIKSVVESGDGGDDVILSREGDKINLKVGIGRELDVTNWSGDLLEVEERPDIKKLKISSKEGQFYIEQEGVTAGTSLPIKIDPKTSRFAVTTQTGDKYLAVLPYEAVQSSLRSRVLSEASGELIGIGEEGRDLSYSISGLKKINLFDIYTLQVKVTAKVSASTGEILKTDEPVWLKFLRPILG